METLTNAKQKRKTTTEQKKKTRTKLKCKEYMRQCVVHEKISRKSSGWKKYGVVCVCVCCRTFNHYLVLRLSVIILMESCCCRYLLFFVSLSCSPVHINRQRLKLKRKMNLKLYDASLRCLLGIQIWPRYLIPLLLLLFSHSWSNVLFIFLFLFCFLIHFFLFIIGVVFFFLFRFFALNYTYLMHVGMIKQKFVFRRPNMNMKRT